MLSLPLAKLSTAPDANPEETKFDWKHDTQDLVAVIDTYGSYGQPSQLLKVVQGTHVRILIEIERLINEGHDLIRTMHEHGIELKSEQLPISSLVRCPLLALRWQLPDKKIRRAQLKFKNSQDYDTIYNHLYQLGLRMSPAGGSPSASATSASRAPATSVPSIVSKDYNPHKTIPSYPPSRLAEVANRPYTAVTAPTSIEAQLQEAAHTRPTSAYTGHTTEARNMVTTFSGPLRPPEYFPRPDSATSVLLDYPDTTSAYQSRDQPMASNEPFQHSSCDRPETAMLLNRPDTGEVPLPPRRELPFPRSSLPSSSGSDSMRPTSRPSTSMMGPPPLPARVASLRPPSSRASNPDAEMLPPLPKPTIVGTTLPKPSWMEQKQQNYQPPAPRTPNPEQTTFPSAYDALAEDPENRPQTSSSTASSPLSYKRAATSTLASNRPLSSLSSAAQNRRRTESHSPLSNPSTPPTSDATSKTIAPQHTAGLSSTDDNLDAYVMQSEEGRRAALNEFIYRQLQNPDFVNLLEDTETCWGRLTRGLD